MVSAKRFDLITTIAEGWSGLFLTLEYRAYSMMSLLGDTNHSMSRSHQKLASCDFG